MIMQFGELSVDIFMASFYNCMVSYIVMVKKFRTVTVIRFLMSILQLLTYPLQLLFNLALLPYFVIFSRHRGYALLYKTKIRLEIMNMGNRMVHQAISEQ